MRSFEDLVGNAMHKAEGRTLESTDKMRIAFAEVIESATTRFSRCDRGHAPDRRFDPHRTGRDTRAEIKKGVFELPMEAKESTTAIRRAVSEQINALKELSEIVAKSGRNNDVSEARPACACARPRRRAARRRAAAPSGPRPATGAAALPSARRSRRGSDAPCAAR